MDAEFFWINDWATIDDLIHRLTGGDVKTINITSDYIYIRTVFFKYRVKPTEENILKLKEYIGTQDA